MLSGQRFPYLGDPWCIASARASVLAMDEVNWGTNLTVRFVYCAEICDSESVCGYRSFRSLGRRAL
jgi:hypothetical protein